MTTIGIYLGLLGLIYLFMSYRIVLLRRKFGVELGDGGQVKLQQAIRAHGNFIEYVPFCVLLMFALAHHNVSTIYLHIAGSILVIARLLHASGLNKATGKTFGRYWGTLFTWLLILLLSLANVILFFSDPN